MLAAASSSATACSPIATGTQLPGQPSKSIKRTTARAPQTAAVAISAAPTPSAHRAPHRTNDPQTTTVAWLLLAGRTKNLSMRSGWKEEDAPRTGRLRRLVKRFFQKACDRRQHAVIHFLLVRSQRLQRRLRDHEGMVASLHDGERRVRMHPLPDMLEEVERAERVARSLREKGWRLQLQQDLIAEPRSVACGAKRIAEADDRFDRIDESDMAAAAPAHALPASTIGP